MNKLLEAINLASFWHKDQKRKVDKTPYIAHPIAVGMILQSITDNENIVVAGILHDILEDTKIEQEIIKNKFNPDVLNYVISVTEDKSITDWRIRKENYIKAIENEIHNVKLISAADKYHNLYTLLNDLEAYGDTIWENFKRGKEQQCWYYQALYNIYNADSEINQLKIITEMKVLIDNIFK
jgi:guanosine-3',5'-bis(diphosphate) 3'-pyrophosphohydrolase